jgi:hypothetical protein
MTKTKKPTADRLCRAVVTIIGPGGESFGIMGPFKHLGAAQKWALRHEQDPRNAGYHCRLEELADPSHRHTVLWASSRGVALRVGAIWIAERDAEVAAMLIGRDP